MTGAEREVLSGALLDVCKDILSVDGTPARPVTPAEAADDAPSVGRTLVASVGLSGLDVKGTLVVMGSSALFRSVYPAELSPMTAAEDDLADWAGEVANQVLGRLKNRFCQRGLDFSISIPSMIRGVRLQVCGGQQQSGIHLTLGVENLLIDVYLQIARTNGRPLLTEESSAEVASVEGDTLLF